MPEKPFLLVSLEEAKTQKLANALQNETCTKVLNLLTKKKSFTESEIANSLKLPLSTIHYNLKQLLEAKLVVADEYHYSSKGREVLHYRLANKYIIIAPQKKKESLGERLKELLPSFLVVAGIALALKLAGLLKNAGKRGLKAAQSLQANANVGPRSLEATKDFAAATTQSAPMPGQPENLFSLITSTPLLLAFLAGALTMIIVLILVLNLARRKKKQ